MINQPNLIVRSCLEEWSRWGTIWGLFFALGTAQLTLVSRWNIWINRWWRRRESNPRPKILPSSFYMLSSSLRFCPAEFSGTSFLQRYPAKISLLIWQAHLRNYPAESTPFADSAGENQQDGWAVLCCYSVFIIVGDYKFSVCFTSRQNLGMLLWASISSSNPFRPLFKI